MSAQREDQLQQFIQLGFILKGIEQGELQTDIAVADRLSDDHALVVEQFAANTLIHRIGIFTASGFRQDAEDYRTDLRLDCDFHITAFDKLIVEVFGIVDALGDEFRPALFAAHFERDPHFQRIKTAGGLHGFVDQIDVAVFFVLFAVEVVGVDGQRFKVALIFDK